MQDLQRRSQTVKDRLASEFAVLDATDKPVLASSGGPAGYVRLDAGIVQEMVDSGHGT